MPLAAKANFNFDYGVNYLKRLNVNLDLKITKFGLSRLYVATFLLSCFVDYSGTDCNLQGIIIFCKNIIRCFSWYAIFIKINASRYPVHNVFVLNARGCSPSDKVSL